MIVCWISPISAFVDGGYIIFYMLIMHSQGVSEGLLQSELPNRQQAWMATLDGGCQFMEMPLSVEMEVYTWPFLIWRSSRSDNLLQMIDKNNRVWLTHYIWQQNQIHQEQMHIGHVIFWLSCSVDVIVSLNFKGWRYHEKLFGNYWHICEAA